MNDGGRAFPDQLGSGMSLRDWFAGMAMSQILQHSETESVYDYEATAVGAYQLADAMIAEKLNRESWAKSIPTDKS